MFNHVVDERLRKILADEQTDEDSVCYALTVTGQCVKDDMQNEDVDLTILDYRVRMFNEADVWWNEEGDAFKAIKSLKEVWLV